MLHFATNSDSYLLFCYVLLNNEFSSRRVQNCSSGTVIQLQSGQTKRVEDMDTDDFVNSAAMNTDLIICYSQVINIQNTGREQHIVTFLVDQQQNAEVGSIFCV